MSDTKKPGPGESYWCNACRSVGMIHCPEAWYGCDSMEIITNAEIERRAVPAEINSEAKA